MIAIIDMQDTGNEAEAIRQTVEYFGFQTLLYKIGRPNDFIDIISGKTKVSTANYLIISAHGDNQKIILPELSEEVYLPKEPRCPFGSEEINQYAQFDKELILSTVCDSGYPQMAKSMLKNGASAFIGPRDYIEGNASLMFITRFFYEIKQNEKKALSAYKLASAIDQETELFQWFE